MEPNSIEISDLSNNKEGVKKAFKILSGQVDIALHIIREVAQTCIDHHMSMWALDELTKDKLLKNLTADNFYIGMIGNDNATAMILQWHDPIFWPHLNENESGFVHKLCIRRKYAGMHLSKEMIDFAITECKKRGLKYLRLDTAGNIKKLCNIYESMGFVKVGQKVIADRDYALYELFISY